MTHGDATVRRGDAEMRRVAQGEMRSIMSFLSATPVKRKRFCLVAVARVLGSSVAPRSRIRQDSCGSWVPLVFPPGAFVRAGQSGRRFRAERVLVPVWLPAAVARVHPGPGARRPVDRHRHVFSRAHASEAHEAVSSLMLSGRHPLGAGSRVGVVPTLQSNRP